MKKFYSLFLIAILALVGLQSQAAVRVVGNNPFGEWSLSNGTDMTLVDGIYTLSVDNLSAGIYFAILDGSESWDNVRRPSSNGAAPTGDWESTSTGGSNSWKIDVAGNYKFEYDAANKKLRVTVSGAVTVDPAYYLVGEVPGWSESDDSTFTDNNGVFTLTKTMSGQFKIKDEKGNWFGAAGDADPYVITEDNPTVNLVDGKNMKLNAESEYTFTIENGVLTVSGFPVAPVEPAYYLVGEVPGWSESDDYKFTNNNGVFTLTKTMSGQFKVKDQDGNWLGAAGDADPYVITKDNPTVDLVDGKNMKLEAESEYTFTIENGVLTVTGFPVAPVEPAYYLIGGFNSWTEKDENYKFANNNGVFTLTKTVSGEFKVLDQDGKYYAAGADAVTVTADNNTFNLYEGGLDNNLNLAAELEYTFTIENGVLTVTGFPVDELQNIVIMGGAAGATEWAQLVELSLNSETGKYESAAVEVAEGYEFKVVENWSVSGDHWKGAESNGVFVVDADQINKELSIEPQSEGENFKFAKAGTFSFVYDKENSKLSINGEFVPDPVDELQNIVIMGGAAGATDWAQLVEFTLNSETGKYETAAVEVAEGYEFKVVENWSVSGDHWKGAESNGAFVVDAEQINKELSIEPQSEGENFKFAKAGSFSFVYDKENSKLWINGEFDPDAITLAEALAGEIGTTVVVGDNVAIADYNLIMGNDGMYNFITDGQGNYARLFVKTEDIMTAPVYGISAGFKAKKIADGVLEFVSGEDNESMEYEVVKFALTNDNFEPVANQVFQLIGYFQLENGVPKVSAFPGTNDKGISTSYVLNTDYATDFDTDDFVVGKKYNFFGVLNPTTAPAGSKLKGHVDPSANSILLLDGSASPATAIDTINATVDAKSIRYYNLQGVESATPFDGLNIVVVEHVDGTTSTSKVIK